MKPPFFLTTALIALTSFTPLLESKTPPSILLSKGTFYSQACQDQFVYTLLYGLLNKQDQGYYLEIGAGQPIDINNSYFFEKNLFWDGISIDISDSFREMWYCHRNNLFLTEDATQSDYEALLQKFPSVIDYLSLDVDDCYDTILKKLPLDKYRFKIITIEHDFYRYGDRYRNEERNILTHYGYHLLCSDVSNGGIVFEDWWIHPDAFPPKVLAQLSSLELKNKDCRSLIQTLQSILP